MRSAGQKIVETVDQVPGPVKKGMPAGLAILAALRTVQQVRQRMRADRTRPRLFGRGHVCVDARVGRASSRSRAGCGGYSRCGRCARFQVRRVRQVVRF